jgi:deazaflavin-dependent oxidoreductase (nitroreductase family)
MWYNSIMIWLLRSPFHGMLDKGIMLITVKGRKSGKEYATPVNYLREGNTLWVTSLRSRTWWRNLKGGAAVDVLLAGHKLRARGEAIVDETEVTQSLLAYFKLAPKYARYYGVSLDAAGQPLPSNCIRAAHERVMIRINLN